MFSRYHMWNWGDPPTFLTWLLPFVIVDGILRGFALWRSARKEQTAWFIALLVVNSLGILPGFYLLTHPDTKTSPKKK